MAKLESTVGVIPFFCGFIAGILVLGSTLMDLGNPLTTKVVQWAIGIPLILFGLLSIFGLSTKVEIPEKGNRRDFYTRSGINLVALLLGAGVAVVSSLVMNAI